MSEDLPFAFERRIAMKKEVAQKLIETTPGFDNESIIALGDLVESPYFATSEEEIEKWPIAKQIAFEAEKQKWFSQTRRHGLDGSIKPFAIGGSDAGTIYGCNKFCPPSVLYEHKRYPELYDAPPTGEQKVIFDTGHRAEPYIRQSFEFSTGIKVTDWTVQMGNKKYPFAAANVDGLLVEDGVLGIYEGKCPQFYPSQKPWMEIKNRGNTPDCLELVPLPYRMQVWFYMAVTGLSFAYICGGGWGFRPDDIGYCRIERLPQAEEAAFMEGIARFVKNTARGKRPSDVDFDDKKKLLEEYSKIAATKKLVDKPVMLPESAKHLITTIKDGEARKKEISKMVKELEKEQGLKEIEDSIVSAKAALAEIMYTAKSAVGADMDGNPVAVTYDFGRKTFDKELCEKEFPEVFEQVYRAKMRSIKVGR